jgi:AraC family transcriptional regulator, transcriptional activator of pobA
LKKQTEHIPIKTRKDSDIPFAYHFSFLRDASVPGFYITGFKDCFSKYPFLKGPHRFNFYSLIYFTHGKGSVDIDGQSFNIKPGRLFLCHMNTEHSFRFDETPEGYYTFFCNDFYSEEFSMIRLLYLFSFSLPIASRIPVRHLDFAPGDISAFSLFKIMQSECRLLRERKNNLPHIIRSYLNILILKLTDILNSSGSKISGDINTIIIKLSHLIEANFAQQQSGEFYARSLQLTEARLNSICKKTLNTSLKKLIQERLIMEVRKTLEQTDLSVSQIAFKFNFSDDSYFNKVFKSYTRLSPGKYRDLHKKILSYFN